MRGASITFEPGCRRLSNVEAIKVHQLVPGRDEVVYKFFLTVGAAVNFGQCAENGVRTKDKIDTCASPFEFAGFAIAAFEDVLVFGDGFPFGAHVEQVDEEI